MGRGGGHVCTILEQCLTDLKLPVLNRERPAYVVLEKACQKAINSVYRGRKHHAIAAVTLSMTRNHYVKANDCLIKYF